MFQKGVSGNPGGKSKNTNPAVLAARRYLEPSIKVLVDGLASNDEKTKVNCAQALLDRGFGKPKETMEFMGEDGGPIITQQLPASAAWIGAMLRARQVSSSEASSEN